MLNKTINGYTIKRKLGEGGMAEVWYAENGIGNPASIKFLKKKFCEDETVVERFRNEAMVMVKLKHPNIRQVYDYVTVDGLPCIIMEYLEGRDMKAIVRERKQIDSATAIHYWNEIASALANTHAKGVIHRDIKPSNIFVTEDGHVKLLDFGIAKVRDSVSGTQTGQKLGTLVYMSPEQITDAKHVDYRTDLYSLAVTFVHLLSGRIPYDTDSSSDFAIMTQIVQEPLSLTGIPSEWRAFLEPYLAKKPEDRPELREYGETTSKFDETTVIHEPSGYNSHPAEGHTDADSTFIESSVPQHNASASPTVDKTEQTSPPDKKSKILMWTTGVMMALTVVGIIVFGHHIVSPMLILFTFLAINIAFLLQLKQKKSKLLIAVSAVVLLASFFLINYSLYGILFLISNPVLVTAVGTEGYIFAKRYGRIKWIHAVLAIAMLVLFGGHCLYF